MASRFASHNAYDPDNISVVGICYTGLVPKHKAVTCVVGRPEGTEATYTCPAVRLSEADNVASQLVDKPIYLNHEPSKGSFGKIVNAWVTKSEEKMSKFVKAGNEPQEARDPDELVVGIRALIRKDRLQEVKDELGIEKLNDVALSVGYNYEDSLKDKLYTVFGKSIKEVSLCKLGFFQRCGIAAQLSDTQNVLKWTHTSGISNTIEVEDILNKSENTIMSTTDIQQDTTPVPVPQPQSVMASSSPSISEEEWSALVTLSATAGKDFNKYQTPTAFIKDVLSDLVQKNDYIFEKQKGAMNETLGVLASINPDMTEKGKEKFVALFKDSSVDGESVASSIHKLAVKYKEQVESQELKKTSVQLSNAQTNVNANVTPVESALVERKVTASAGQHANESKVDPSFAQQMKELNETGFCTPKINMAEMRSWVNEMKSGGKRMN